MKRRVLLINFVRPYTLDRHTTKSKYRMATPGLLYLKDALNQVGAAAVDSLLNLEPPLETVVSHKYEELDTDRVREALDKVRIHRTSSPLDALLSLGLILKAIRNKREYGFNTRHGPRDAEILGPTRKLLDNLCQAALVISRSFQSA